MVNKEEIMLVILSLVVFFIVLCGCVFMAGISTEKQISKNLSNKTDDRVHETKTCVSDEDCDDGNSCTINDCREGKCIEIEVILCYQSDGCCPKKKKKKNDNDCSPS